MSYCYSLYGEKKSDAGFVGLNNAGATCYMNSLLQTLYMTPEFRTLIFKFRHEPDRDGPKDGCIPYQLQRLFARLTLYKGRSVDTKALRKSFGWDQTDAFMQHDIQELNRVLFDALEKTLKGTPDENALKELYNGVTNSIINCLDCGYKSRREEQFADVSLPLKSTLRDCFVEFATPDRLDGDNKYHCSGCDKRCDALKGAQFHAFPPLLTIQLRRFDLCYTTFQTIKKNDLCTFPLFLQTREFIDRFFSAEDFTKPTDTTDLSAAEAPEAAEKTDGESDALAKVPAKYASLFDTVPSSPETYQLFALCIHSGSARGGHYYAFIRDVTSGKWYEFNDSTVSEIDYSEIVRVFGDEPEEYSIRDSFAASGARFYSTEFGWVGQGYEKSNTQYGTSAYLLLYRRTDIDTPFPSIDLLPEDVLEDVEALNSNDLVREQVREERGRHTTLRVYSNIARGPTTFNTSGPGVVSARGNYVDVHSLFQSCAGRSSLFQPPMGLHTPIKLDVYRDVPLSELREAILDALSKNLGVPLPELETFGDPMVHIVKEQVSRFVPDKALNPLSNTTETCQNISDTIGKQVHNVHSYLSGSITYSSASPSAIFLNFRGSTPGYTAADRDSCTSRTGHPVVTIFYMKKEEAARLGISPTVLSLISTLIQTESQGRREEIEHAEKLSTAIVRISESDSDEPTDADDRGTDACIGTDTPAEAESSTKDAHDKETKEHTETESPITDISDNLAVESDLVGIPIPPIFVEPTDSYTAVRARLYSHVIDSLARVVVVSTRIVQELEEHHVNMSLLMTPKGLERVTGNQELCEHILRVLATIDPEGPDHAEGFARVAELIGAEVLPSVDRLGIYNLDSDSTGSLIRPYRVWEREQEFQNEYWNRQYGITEANRLFEEHLMHCEVGDPMRRKKRSKTNPELPRETTFSKFFFGVSSPLVLHIRALEQDLTLMTPHYVPEEARDNESVELGAGDPASDELLRDHSKLANFTPLYVTAPNEKRVRYKLSFDLRKTGGDLLRHLADKIPGIEPEEIRMSIGYSYRLNNMHVSDDKKSLADKDVAAIELSSYSTIGLNDVLAETSLKSYDIKVVCLSGGLSATPGHSIVNVWISKEVAEASAERQELFAALREQNIIATPGLDAFDIRKLGQCSIKNQASPAEIIAAIHTRVETILSKLRKKEEPVPLAEFLADAEPFLADASNGLVRIRHGSTIGGIKNFALPGSYWQPCEPLSHVVRYYNSRSNAALVIEILRPETAAIVNFSKPIKYSISRIACLWLGFPQAMIRLLQDSMGMDAPETKPAEPAEAKQEDAAKEDAKGPAVRPLPQWRKILALFNTTCIHVINTTELTDLRERLTAVFSRFFPELVDEGTRLDYFTTFSFRPATPTRVKEESEDLYTTGYHRQQAATGDDAAPVPDKKEVRSLTYNYNSGQQTFLASEDKSAFVFFISPEEHKLFKTLEEAYTSRWTEMTYSGYSYSSSFYGEYKSRRERGLKIETYADRKDKEAAAAEAAAGVAAEAAPEAAAEPQDVEKPKE
eukprot:gnl/Chilomastix_cuspidata/176.p1 GENE.gnl/Chilomastix_cuspidata/176~~gnl/Chilomastix_cuspidata/176.p1  ORF type:complete len:1541 (+),score=426.79 gnl/Chilomastix_cuspidata/176:32-4624(+)